MCDWNISVLSADYVKQRLCMPWTIDWFIDRLSRPSWRKMPTRTFGYFCTRVPVGYLNGYPGTRGSDETPHRTHRPHRPYIIYNFSFFFFLSLFSFSFSLPVTQCLSVQTHRQIERERGRWAAGTGKWDRSVSFLNTITRQNPLKHDDWRRN